MDIFWILIAFVSGAAARLVRLPSLVGFLIAGMILSGFGVSGGAVLDELGDIGVALLLFTVGLDLRVRSFTRPEVIGAGGLHFLLTGLLAATVALLAGVQVTGAVVLGAALAVSSIILAAKSLEERDELGSYHGRVAIGILLLQTVVMGVVLGFIGPSAPSRWAPLVVLVVPLRPFLTRLLGRLDGRDLVLLFGLLLAMGGAWLFEQVGISGELGALAAGALLAGHPDTERLAERLWSLKEVFLAAFFLRVGLVGLPPVADVALAIALIGFLLLKGGMFFGLLAAFRLKARTAFITSVALTSYSGITLIVAVAAVEAGILQEGLIAVLSVATAASYVINAVATRFSLTIWRGVSSLLSIAEREGKHRETLPSTLGKSEYLIIGMGRAGTAAYDRLASRGFCVTGMDYDPGKIAEQRAALRRVVYGDGRDRALWRELDLSQIKAVVLGVPGPQSKVEVTRALRDSGYDGAISALTGDTVEQATLVSAGASAVHLARDQAGRALADYVAGNQSPSAQPRVIGLDVRLEEDASASTPPD